MLDEFWLRQHARGAIENGKLPAQRPDRVMGGPGCGEPCALCGETLGRTQMELEPEFMEDGEAPKPYKYHLHPLCFAAWECECGKIEGDWRSALHA